MGWAAWPAAILLFAACTGGTSLIERSPDAGGTQPARVRKASFRLAVIGDFGTGEAAERAVADEIRARREHLDALLTTGDNVYPSGDPDEFRSAWVQPYGWVARSGLNVVASLGNHDVRTDDGRPVMRLLSIPNEWYHEVIGDADIFVLDANRPDDAQQLRWLREALARASGAWSIAVFHQPAYTCGEYRGDARIQQRWVPLFERFGVDLVLNGHDHNYQRFAAVKGVTYVVSGGGGNSNLYPLEECPESYPERLVGNARAHHFLLVEGSSRRLSLRAITDGGRVIDAFTLRSGSTG